MSPKENATTEKFSADKQVDGRTNGTADTQDAGAEEPKPRSESDNKAKSDQKPTKSSPKKRKAEDDAGKEPTKASRKSARGAPKSKPSEIQVLNYLLGDEALDLCRPEDELTDLKNRGKDTKTYSGSALSPFEELLCAVVLSRPISHRLGLRTIRTILNKPYEFTSPKAINAASVEKRHEAMFDAHTQHKDKTATQIGMIAQVVTEKFATNESDTSLDKVRSQANKSWDEERDLLQSSIKGLGKTGLDIFFRRVQWLWPEAYPFVDERTARGVEKLGLPKQAEQLRKLIEAKWADLETGHLAGGSKGEKQMRAFVVVCERATGADLEGKIEALLEAAAAKA